MKINHFPEDTDYDHDSAEYLLRTWVGEWCGVCECVKEPGGMRKEGGGGRGWAELEPHS